MTRILAVIGLVAVFAAPAALAQGQVLSVSPRQVNFGNVEFETSSTVTIRLTNRTSQPVAVRIVEQVPDDLVPGVSPSTCLDTQPITLAGGATCTYTVQFVPGSTFRQPERGTLRIAALDPDTGTVLQTVVVKLRGRGFAP